MKTALFAILFVAAPVVSARAPWQCRVAWCFALLAPQRRRFSRRRTDLVVVASAVAARAATTLAGTAAESIERRASPSARRVRRGHWACARTEAAPSAGGTVVECCIAHWISRIGFKTSVTAEMGVGPKWDKAH